MKYSINLSTYINIKIVTLNLYRGNIKFETRKETKGNFIKLPLETKFILSETLETNLADRPNIKIKVAFLGH